MYDHEYIKFIRREINSNLQENLQVKIKIEFNPKTCIIILLHFTLTFPYQTMKTSIVRPASQASSTYSVSKPTFQKKLRPRIRGLSQAEGKLNQSTDLNKQMNKNTQQFHSSRSYQIIPERKQPINTPFNQTMTKLTQVNFMNHCEEGCLCSQCSCGRHMCKFNNIKPDLTKTTIYKKDFEKKAGLTGPIIFAKEYNKLDGPHLEMNSTQRQHFTNREGDRIERPIPQDELKCHGPAPILTTYKSLFPGHKGPNQYVKPTDRHTRDSFPLRSKSTYAKSYVNKSQPKDDYKYFNDQLKTGGNWYGQTSYGNFFENPNPEYHAKKIKIVQKLELNPGFTHQYETVYKNDFIPQEKAVCAARIHLDTSGKGRFSGTKSVFAENSDFKAMSPHYQAFSTSGFKFI